MLNYNDQMLE